MTLNIGFSLITTPNQRRNKSIYDFYNSSLSSLL